MIPQCLAIGAGKGGVLKTTTATQLAAAAAHAGWSVLLVDADPQGNAMFDLGYESDGGHGLAEALLHRTPLVPRRSDRDGLHYISGGPQLEAVISEGAHNPNVLYSLNDAVEGVADDFDLIVVDSPPRELVIRRFVLTAAHYLVVPTGIDRASRVGLADIAGTVREIRESSNVDLEVLGVFTGPLPVAGTRMKQRMIERVGALIDDDELVHQTVIRYAPLIAEACREQGIVASEYAGLASQDPPWYQTKRTPTQTYSSAAQGLAADWDALCTEILQRFTSAQLNWQVTQ